MENNGNSEVSSLPKNKNVARGDVDTTIPKNASEISGPTEKDTREQVLGAFNEAYSFFTNFDTSRLEPSQQAERDYLRAVKEATLDKNRGSRRIRFKDVEGKEHSEQEYVPVDSLINFLRERIISGELSNEDLEKYKATEKILHRNAKEHYRTPKKKELIRKQARINLEAQRVSTDPRLTKGNEHDDDLEAGNILFRRRELILPRVSKTHAVANLELNPSEEPENEPLHKESGSSTLPPSEEIEDKPVEVSESEPTPPALDSETLSMPDLEPPTSIELSPDESEASIDSPKESKSESAPDEKLESSTELPLDELGNEPVDEDREVEPTPLMLDEVRYEVMIANRSEDLRLNARMLAEQHLRAEQRRGNMFNPLNWARKTRLRVLEEYYRQRYIQEATRQMRENSNTYLGLDLFTNAAVDASRQVENERAAGAAKIEQLKTGENIAGQQIIETTGPLKDLVFDEVLARVVTGEINDEGQIQQTLREFVQNHQDNEQVAELFGNDATRFGTLAEYFASDLLEVGRQLMQDQEAHNYSLERLKELTTIKLANVNWAYDSDIQWSLADRAIAWSQRGNRGWLLNPAVVGATTSIGIYGVLSAAKQGGSALITAPGAGLLVGAGLAAIRRAHDLKIDRASHQAEREYGATTPEDGARRRQALDAYQYETTSFSALLNGGERQNVFGDQRGMRELLALDVSSENPSAGAHREALLRRAAEIRARLDFGVNRQKGLIVFEGRESIEQNRLELVRATAEARVKLRNAGMTDDQINNRLTEFEGQWTNQFSQNVADRDRAFNTYRTRQALYSAGIGGATGLTLGLGGSFLTEKIANSVSGINAGGIKIPDRQFSTPGADKLPGFADTPKETARENIRQALKEKRPIEIGDTRLTIDDGGRLVVTGPDGVTQLVPRSQVLENGNIQINGSIPQELSLKLQENGFTVDSKSIESSIPQITPETPLVQSTIFGHDVKIPEGTGWIDNPDGSWDLVHNQRPDVVLIDNARIVDGQLIYDADNSLLGSNAFEVKTVEIESAGTTTEQITGPEGLWSKEKTPIARREWYAYDTPNSDHNELKAYNSVFTASNGEKGVIWDMSHMQAAYQSGVNPSSIDVQDVIRNGQAGFAFTLPGDQRNPIWFSDLADGIADGKISLDPSDLATKIDPNDPNSMSVGEFSKIVLNQNALRDIPNGPLSTELTNRQNVFSLGMDGEMGFIEAARIKEENGQKILQAFATAQGSSPIPDAIEIEKPTTFQNVFEARPATIGFPTETTTIIPPEATSTTELPVIPWVMTPRSPLETIQTPTPPPLSYGRRRSSYGNSAVREGTPTAPPDMPEVFTPADEVLGATDDEIASPSNPVPAPPSTEIDQLTIEAFLNDDSVSPIESIDRARSVERAKEFVDSEEVSDAEEAGGISKTAAEQLFKNILVWLKNTNLPEAEREDPTLDPAIYTSLLTSLATYNGTSDDRVKHIANILAKFQRDAHFDITTGDIDKNTFSLALLYDLVKDLRLKS